MHIRARRGAYRIPSQLPRPLACLGQCRSLQPVFPFLNPPSSPSPWRPLLSSSGRSASSGRMTIVLSQGKRGPVPSVLSCILLLAPKSPCRAAKAPPDLGACLPIPTSPTVHFYPLRFPLEPAGSGCTHFLPPQVADTLRGSFLYALLSCKISL